MAYIDPVQLDDAVASVTGPMMLPQARRRVNVGGTLTQDAQPETSMLPAARARLRRLIDQQAEIEGQAIDTKGMQEFARRQGEAGESAMLNALAAQFAGDNFAPVQAQFLKRASAAREPMKFGTGMLTPDGQFVRDPFAARERELARLDRLITADTNYLTAAERAEQTKYERERDRQDRLEREADRRSERDRAYQLQRDLAQYRMSRGGSQKAPAGYQWTTTADGQPALTFIPGGPADPSAKPAGNASEDERKSSTLLMRMDDALRTMNKVSGESPSAATPGFTASMISNVPLVGEIAANVITPENRQRIEAAQLDALDAALTLATGAAYTKEQLRGLSKSYFPQIGDSEQTIKEKRLRFANVIESAKTRAGRALPQGMQPGGAPGAAPANNDPLGLRR